MRYEHITFCCERFMHRLGRNSLNPAVVKLNENLVDLDSVRKKCRQDFVLSALDVYFEHIQASMAQLLHEILERTELNLNGSGER